ncbi:hypothetical protein SAMD00019534_088150 [Acytostelium subglobosum LB1]|uniref:hypothetical protein n=1 Tax=Acytostelium subglobosum LB1 TaxID=1410327 RepID=UPI000644FDF3|nr:hypothetical protein SAMD00019534_088150 [Acytostelium subglobosum LB1]GAM25640.1 hypothetical protein SAMD00019534_088150 [Acytostelium subglobosum LB1]|eukprot:XP_012751626.1 hypothetical protein SAMD00019534_088150 [Acytostelium subglobosum LB1]
MLGLVADQTLFTGINNMYNSISGLSWRAWYSVGYNGSYINLEGGSAKGTTTTVYPNNAQLSSVTTASRFFAYSNGTLVSDGPGSTPSASILIVFGATPATVFEVSSQTSYVFPTSGGRINIRLFNFGRPSNPDTITATLNGATLQMTADFWTGSATITIPPGVKDGSLVIRDVTKNQVAAQSISISYIEPMISSWTPENAPTSGAVTTFIGTNFFNNADQVTVLLGSQSNLSMAATPTFTSITVNVPAGTGYHSGAIFIGEKSALFEYRYAAPTISQWTTLDSVVVTVTGTNFGVWPERVTIETTDGEVIAHPDSVTHTQLVFTSKPSHLRNGNYTINVSKQVTNNITVINRPNITFVNQPPVTGGTITIEGSFFGKTLSNNASTSPSFYVTSAQQVEMASKCSYLYTPMWNGSQTYLITCDIAMGTGRLTARAFVDGMYSSNYSLTYQEPTVFSASTVLPTGGDVTVSGTNFATTGLNVIIGGVQCDSQFFNNTMLVCRNFKGDITTNANGLAYVNVTVDGVQGGSFAFAYDIPLNTTQPCLMDCLNGGTCNNNTGLCICPPLWDDLDCSKRKNNNSNTPIPDGTGGTIIVGDGFNFTVAITYLREQSSFQNVKTLDMNYIEWYKRSNTSSNYIFQGTFAGETVVVTVNMTIYDEAKEINFAGETISMPSNSMKYLITIANWTFSSNLNTLQIIYSSVAPNQTQQDCGSQTATSTSSGQNLQGSLTWYQIKSGGSILLAKFAQFMIVDSRIARSSVVALSNDDVLYNISSNQYSFMTAIQTGAFHTSVMIDPNFSSLIEPTSGRSCDAGGITGWKLIVVIVASVIGGIAIVTLVALYIRHRVIKGKLQRELHSRSTSLHDN